MSLTTQDIDAFESAVQSAEKIIITGHKYPDIDAVGSCLALYQALINQGKKVYLWFASESLNQFNFLPYSEKIHKEFPSQFLFDLAIICDSSSLDRVNKCHYFQQQEQPFRVVNIDHHQDNTNFGDTNLVTVISSVGELLYTCFSHLNWTITPEMATCLYAAISFDTGRFAYSNVTEDTLKAAANLVACGAKPYELAQIMDENKKMVDFDLIKLAIDNLVTNDEKKYAYTIIPKQAPKGHVKLIDFIRQLGNYELFIVFQELNSKQIKINLRSKRHYDVCEFAKPFGGGGHKHAAGIVLKESLKKSIETITSAI